MKVTTDLDRISHRKAASGTHWSNRWTYPVFIINARRDYIGWSAPRGASPLAWQISTQGKHERRFNSSNDFACVWLERATRILSR